MKPRSYQFLAKIFVFLRLTTPFLIFINPLLATLIILFLDGMDGFVFNKAGISLEKYQWTDKLLDLYWYTVILIWSITNPLPSTISQLLIFFYFFRLLGEILFFIKKERKIFLWFPNIFEVLFWFYLLAKILNLPQLLTPPLFWPLLIIAALLKELQEFLIHEINFSSFNFISGKKILNWKK